MPREIRNWKPEFPNLKEPLEPKDYRARLIALAESQVGTTDPRRYIREFAPIYWPDGWHGKSWCQIFLGWCCLTIGLPVELWKDGGGNFFPKLKQISREQAQPGDFTCLPKTKAGAWVWHGALWLARDGYFDESIDGNTSEGVAHRRRDIRAYNPRPLYYSSQRLIDAALARDRTPAEPPV